MNTTVRETTAFWCFKCRKEIENFDYYEEENELGNNTVERMKCCEPTGYSVVRVSNSEIDEAREENINERNEARKMISTRNEIGLTVSPELTSKSILKKVSLQDRLGRIQKETCGGDVVEIQVVRKLAHEEDIRILDMNKANISLRNIFCYEDEISLKDDY